MIRRHKHQLAIFGSLAFASALCVGLFVVRTAYTGIPAYWFLIWNLILAWMPLLFSSIAYGFYSVRSKATYAAVAACAVAWLIFFPNAPYVITDLIHLRPTGSAPLWFDLVMIVSFAWTGLSLGFVSLYMMQDMVSRSLGRIAGWLFVAATLSLSGFGIYLGRFLRWNSWDVFFDPLSLIADIWIRLRHPLGDPRAFAFSILFSVFAFSAYLILFNFGQLRPEPHRTK